MLGFSNGRRAARSARRVMMGGLLVWLASPQAASAVCRIVEPVSESGEDGVLFDPLTTVVMVRAPDQHVGWECPSVEPGDAGMATVDGGMAELDAGPASSGADMGPDADGADGGTRTADGGASDARVDGGASDARVDGGTADPDIPVCPDGSPATKVYGTLSHVVVQPAIYGGGGKAGMIMPVPRRADVHGAPDALMAGIERISGGWVREEVTYVEDESLGFQCSDPHYSRRERSLGESLLAGLFAGPLFATGCGDDGEYYRPGLETYDAGRVVYPRDAGPDAEPSEEDAVVYETIPVGEDYEVTVLSATTLTALSAWMDERQLAHDDVDDAAFERYIGEGQWFVAVQVQPPAVTDPGEKRVLPPLVVSYVGGELPISHELTYDPAGGIVETDLVVLAPTQTRLEDGDGLLRQAQPFELSPLDPDDRALRGFGLSEGWMTRIHIERRMAEEKMDTRVIADAATEPHGEGGLVQRETTVRIPLACCPGTNSVPRANAGAEHHEVYEYPLGEDSPVSAEFYSTAPPEELCGGYYSPPRSSPTTRSDYEPDYGCEGGACSVSGFGISGAPLILALILTARRRRQLRRSGALSGRRRSSS
jgi:hypothetical protein